MERLTKFTNNTDNDKIIPYTLEDRCMIYSKSVLGKVTERLGKYEDTGLSPEEFKESVDFILELNKKVHKVINELRYFNDINGYNDTVSIPKSIIENIIIEYDTLEK